MANYNIGPKIGIEGEAEFRRQISRINSEYRSMDSYLKSVEKSMEQNGKTQEGLKAKMNGLNQQLKLQEQKHKELSDALELVRKKFGDGSAEVMRYEGAILDVENTTAALRRELDDTEGELKRMADGLEYVAEEADEAGEEVSGFGDILKANLASDAILDTLEQVADVVIEVGQASIEAAAEVKAANAQFSQTFGDLEGTATSALRSISDETGIAVTRLQGGYTALYAFTKSVGGDTDTALNIAQRALTAAADSAAYYDRTMEDATETLQSFLKGNYENDAALGIAATETTRNAKANELYAKSFKDLTEAQKVDVLLSMVEAGNAASGALGQAAREADSWANVQGEFNEALRQTMAWLGSPVLSGIIPIIQGVTAGLKELTAVSAWEQLNSGVQRFETGIRDAETALSESNDQIAATSGLAREYVSRLQELEESGLETADSQREYAQTVELLNTLLPDLGLTINNVTGRLDQNTESILDNIDALQNQIKAQAQQEYYADIIAQQVAVEKDLAAARLRQSEIQARINVLQSQGVQSVDRFSAAQAEAAGAGMLFWNSLSEQEKELYQLQSELGATNSAIAEGESVTAEYAATLKTAAAAMEDTGKQSGELAEETDAVSESMSALADIYSAAKSDARDSIESQIGLFTELEAQSDVSAEKIIANWGKQREAFANYSDNLKKAVDMGLDEALIAQLADGSQQSMLILEEFVNGTALSVDEINAEFRGLSEAKSVAVNSMADVRTSVNSEYQKLRQDIENSGKYVMEGGARGIRNYAWLLEQAMGEAAALANKAYRMGWEINSPSRIMAENSNYIIDGGVLQIQRRTRDMEQAMAELARSGNEAYLQEQLDYVAQYPSLVAGSPGYGGATTTTQTYSYGPVTVQVYAQPGDDVDALADRVVGKINAMHSRKGAAF